LDNKVFDIIDALCNHEVQYTQQLHISLNIFLMFSSQLRQTGLQIANLHIKCFILRLTLITRKGSQFWILHKQTLTNSNLKPYNTLTNHIYYV